MSFLFLTAALAALVTLTSPTVRACEVALVLAIDVSNSVDSGLHIDQLTNPAQGNRGPAVCRQNRQRLSPDPVGGQRLDGHPPNFGGFVWH